MTMMHVRHVRMPMLEWLVFVKMRVWFARRVINATPVAMVLVVAPPRSIDKRVGAGRVFISS
jgi:hypothetical protein